MANIAARSAEELCNWGHGGLGSSALKSMAGMMAVLVDDMARHAEVIVITRSAMDELALREDCAKASVPLHNRKQANRKLTFHARVAGASSLLGLWRLNLLLFGESTRHRHLLGSFGLRLRANPLGSAGEGHTVLDEALDEPMALARAVNTRSDASLTEVVVAVIADAAVIVCVGRRLVASVAIDGPWVRHWGSWRLLHAESELTGPRKACELSEEI